MGSHLTSLQRDLRNTLAQYSAHALPRCCGSGGLGRWGSRRSHAARADQREPEEIISSSGKYRPGRSRRRLPTVWKEYDKYSGNWWGVTQKRQLQDMTQIVLRRLKANEFTIARCIQDLVLTMMLGLAASALPLNGQDDEAEARRLYAAGKAAFKDNDFEIAAQDFERAANLARKTP